MEQPALSVADLQQQMAALQAHYQHELDLLRGQVTGNQGHHRSVLKAKPPPLFDGNSRQDPMEWCYAMDLYFDACNDTDDPARISFARTRMDKDAITWLRAQDDSGFMATIQTWDDFKNALIHQFQSINRHTSARDTLRTMCQRSNETVRAYATAMRRVHLRLPGLTGDEKLDRFISGLFDDFIRQECFIRDWNNDFEAAVAFADKLEAARRRTRAVRVRPNFNPTRDNFNRSRDNSNGYRTNNNAHVHAHNNYNGAQAMELGLVGQARAARMPPADRSRLMDEGRCFYCKEKGHRASECPQKKNPQQGNGYSRQ